MEITKINHYKNYDYVEINGAFKLKINDKESIVLQSLEKLKQYIDYLESSKLLLNKLHQKEKDNLKKIRINDAKKFSINGTTLSKNQFLEIFKKEIEADPEDEVLLKVWKHTENSSFFNLDGFLFVISY